jgi:hypothetical protein
VPAYRDRLLVRPGITGLAQVLQEPDVDLHHIRRKLAYDMFYIGHAGFWFDLRIVAATLLHLTRVPGRWISRFLQLPDSIPRGGDAALGEESIPVSPRVCPYYSN